MRSFRDLFSGAASLATLSMLSIGQANAYVAHNLPEPTTMSLVAAGIAGVVVAARLRRRK